MALQFPTNPQTGDTYTHGTTNYVFNGTAWDGTDTTTTLAYGDIIGERTYPYADNTIHVSTSGNNTTADGSVSLPFATIQAAATHAAKFTWTANPIIKVADGTYQVGSGVQLPVIRHADGMYRYAYIRGNTSNQDAVVIQATSGSAVSVLQEQSIWKLEYVKCIGSDGTMSVAAGILSITNITIACTAGNVWWSGFMVRSYDKGSVFIEGNIKVASSSCYSVFAAYRGGSIQGHSVSTTNISTALTLTYFALSQIQGIVELPGVSYTGSAVTGSKYRADYNSFIGAWGKTFPGSTAGSLGASSSYGA